MEDEIDKFISNLLEDLKNNRLILPTLPQVAIKVSDTLDNPKSTAREISKIISTDVALTTRLIHVANSPIVRGNSKVEDVQSAITRLGLKSVKNLVTTLLIKQLFHTRYDSLKKRMEQLWSHSTHVAAISYIIARDHTKLEPDEAMLGGLIHDIGELPILSYAEKYPSIANDENTLSKICRQVGPVLGKTMLTAWRFADELKIIPAEREVLERTGSDKVEYVDIVLLANLHSYIGKKHRLANIDWENIPALKKLGLTPDVSIKALHEAREEITEVQKLLTG
ncbi:MAG: HDOD domain-containing protein [Gammaproteobacteria bacterium]|nr:HDOD domain-containing protein [Gammaproteobacteria bacterium]